jgi:hypothetical protein
MSLERLFSMRLEDRGVWPSERITAYESRVVGRVKACGVEYVAVWVVSPCLPGIDE